MVQIFSPKILENALNTQYRAKGFENWTYEVENIDGALHRLGARLYGIRHKGPPIGLPNKLHNSLNL